MINVWYMGSPFCTGNAAVAALTIEVSILHSLPEVARGLLWAWNVSTINKRATADVARWDLLAGKLLISCGRDSLDGLFGLRPSGEAEAGEHQDGRDQKSTRLNSSHQLISYAVFCLK